MVESRLGAFRNKQHQSLPIVFLFFSVFFSHPTNAAVAGSTPSTGAHAHKHIPVVGETVQVIVVALLGSGRYLPVHPHMGWELKGSQTHTLFSASHSRPGSQPVTSHICRTPYQHTRESSNVESKPYGHYFPFTNSKKFWMH